MTPTDEKGQAILSESEITMVALHLSWHRKSKNSREREKDLQDVRDVLHALVSARAIRQLTNLLRDLEWRI